ncbi:MULTISPECIES: metal ABC transporter ATP-binding protein [Pseudomonadaceae]|jgi:zinc/manganese transport system ATP-binding protein|uniref:Manganese ABC transporter ATP-binding protein n=1 Tax=Stutzerimonas stutzeri TaxID=316 RepID=A0A0D9AI12_STUST|nr:ATP-binding cassette domain-containing protein [Stutzerimonas stutzeri]KJH80638.1 manganese ABC transporter ATP-binding protein [Stutzerimonas stutzeri]
MIECHALQWGAGGTALTPPLDLKLPAGSLTAVIGGNGSGKSSLLKVIAGLDRPLAGRIEVGVPLLGGVSYLPQQQQVDRQFPIRLAELVSAGLWRSRIGRSEQRMRLRQALADWGLLDLQTQGLHALSGGELQRALLARLSLTDAQLLLLDEPEAALDEVGVRLLWQHIEHWQRQGRTLMWVSHNLAGLSQKHCEALMIARGGCIFAPIGQFIADRQRFGQVA